MATSDTVTPVLLRDVAAAEEYRVSRSVASIAHEVRPFTGGMATRSEPGNWSNGVFGSGWSGEVDPEEFRSIVDWYESAGIEPRFELCPFADPSLVRLLAEERFVPRAFEQVFFRPLDDGRSLDAPSSAPPSLVIEPVDPGDEAAVDAYARLALSGFLPEGDSPSEAALELSRRVARHPRMIAIVAWLDGERVAAGALEMAGDVAAFFGAMTVKSARRRGIQQALLAWRLRRAAEGGAKWATISGRPGEGTERNVRRMGFEVAYTKVVVVRPGPRLAPVVE